VLSGALLLGAALTALVLIDGSTGPERDRNERAARLAAPGAADTTPLHPQSPRVQPPAPAWPRGHGAALLLGGPDPIRRPTPPAALVPAPVAQPTRPYTHAPAPPPSRSPVEPPAPPDVPAPAPAPVAQPAPRTPAQSAAAREFGFER
jgi:hypothetical protein